MSEPSTPLMRQYAAIKKEHPSALLFFRLGDFYELFFDDAVLAARELQITLTSRNKEKGIAIPMCGVPHHAAEGYISKLIRKGFKVAICEQVEDPARGQEAGAAGSHARGHPWYGGGFVAEFGRKQLSGGDCADRRTRWLCRPRSFDRRISRHRVSGRRRRQKNPGRNSAIAPQGSPVRVLCSAIRGAQGARAASLAQVQSDGLGATRKLRSTTGSSPPTTPSRCWKTISECCRSKALACPASRRLRPPRAPSSITSAPPSAEP